LLPSHDTHTLLLSAASCYSIAENGDVEAPNERGMRLVAFAPGVTGDEDGDSEAALKKRLRSENVQDSMVIIRKQLSLRERHGEEEVAAAEEEAEEGGQQGSGEEEAVLAGMGPSSTSDGQRHVRLVAP
jgi:hypothetical protein